MISNEWHVKSVTVTDEGNDRSIRIQEWQVRRTRLITMRLFWYLLLLQNLLLLYWKLWMLFIFLLWFSFFQLIILGLVRFHRKLLKTIIAFVFLYIFVVDVNVFVVALLVVADHIMYSCGQSMFIWDSWRLPLSLCGGGWEVSFMSNPNLVEVVLCCWGWGCDNILNCEGKQFYDRFFVTKLFLSKCKDDIRKMNLTLHRFL